MKIVFASYVYSPDYSTPQAWIKHTEIYGGILRELAKKHTVISIDQINYQGEQVHNGVQYQFKRFTKVGRYIPTKLHHHIKSLKPDVVFIHGLHFPAQIIQLRWLLGTGVKIIAQHHAEQPFTGGTKKKLQQIADKYINAYLFASREMGMDWVKKGNLAFTNKIHGVMEVSSVFGPIDKQTALNKTNVTGSPVFLWVGRLDQNKDPLTVVKAFLQFALINSSARFYMIYQIDELLPDIIKLINQHPTAGKSIVLVGEIPHYDLLSWFNSADFLLSGSHTKARARQFVKPYHAGAYQL